MTDETTQPPAPRKDVTGNRPKKANSTAGVNISGGAPRPSSRGSNKKPAGATSSQVDPNDTFKKNGDAKKKDGVDSKKSDRRGGRSQSQGRAGGGGGSHRKSQTSQSTAPRSGGNTAKDPRPAASSPIPVPGAEGSDALTSLQRVITDLKSISPPSQSSAIPASVSMPLPQPQVSSNLPPNAPIFQPGAAGFPVSSAAAEAARHRKAASLGSHSSGIPTYPHQMLQFSSQLGAMIEDNEDVRTPQQQQFEEGEIPEQIYGQQPFPRGSQPPGFTAPRFAALAGQQQEQSETIGPSGRPMLAPSFTFGARRRTASNVPLGPPILEGEDLGFQFPQQNQHSDYQSDSSQQQNNNPGNESHGQLPDLMREQVRLNQSPFPVLCRPLHLRILSSLLFKTRSMLSSSSSNSSFSSKWPPIKSWRHSTMLS